MLCGELETLEAEFDNIVSALEDPNLTEDGRVQLQQAYDRMLQKIEQHRRFGHSGAPCFEEEAEVA